MKVLGFLGTVAAFTFYGYGRARQEFVREKLRLVEEYSLVQSGKWTYTHDDGWMDGT